MGRAEGVGRTGGEGRAEGVRRMGHSPDSHRITSPSGLEMSWSPERGAKIDSLRDASGREWLSRSRREGVAPGRAFGDAEMAGWDECVPTIDACVVGGRSLPDHGDAWDSAWEGDGDSVVMSGWAWPYELRRTARVSPSGGLRLEYSARAADGAPEEGIPFLWVAHPQFVAPPGTRVHLDPQPSRVVDVLDDGRPELPWNPSVSTIDALEPGGCRKVAALPCDTVASAVLERADGGRLRLSWSAECRFVSVWFDRSAYAPSDVIAIEPAIARGDSLSEAIANGTAPILTAGRALTWWLDIDAAQPPGVAPSS